MCSLHTYRHKQGKIFLTACFLTAIVAWRKMGSLFEITLLHPAILFSSILLVYKYTVKTALKLQCAPDNGVFINIDGESQLMSRRFDILTLLCTKVF